MPILKKLFKFFSIAVVIAIIAYWCSVKHLVYLSEPSLDKKYIAQVEIRADALGLYVASYLVVRRQDSLDIVKQYPLLSPRDAVQDITSAVHSIAWENEIIKVDIESPHYSGPKQFSVSN